MKYIRTKDGRIVDLKRKVNGYTFLHYNDNEIEFGTYAGWYWLSEEHGYELECKDIDVIAQADTIEELCDGWVLESKAYTARFCVIYNTSENKKEMKRIRLEEDEKLFAFIKTKKGLIYIAKMNNEGELELL